MLTQKHRFFMLRQGCKLLFLSKVQSQKRTSGKLEQPGSSSASAVTGETPASLEVAAGQSPLTASSSSAPRQRSHAGLKGFICLRPAGILGASFVREACRSRRHVGNAEQKTICEEQTRSRSGASADGPKLSGPRAASLCFMIYTHLSSLIYFLHAPSSCPIILLDASPGPSRTRLLRRHARNNNRRPSSRITKASGDKARCDCIRKIV